MRELRSVTGRGTALWGDRKYSFSLGRRTATRWTADRSRFREVVQYEIDVEDESVGPRLFDSDAERAAFMQASFSEVSFAPIEPALEVEQPHALQGLVGEELAQVVFVRDYLQLGFDSPGLTLYVWPRIVGAEDALRHGDPGYLDRLVGLIGSPLVVVDELLDQGLVLEFVGGARLVVPLDGTDANGPEAATYDGGAGLMVWEVESID